MSNNEKNFYIILTALVIFIIGLQIGIKHGRILEKEELGGCFGYVMAN